MSADVSKPYKDHSAWMRGLFMLIFMFFMGVAKFVTFVVVLVQFVKVIFTSETNQKLLGFGESLSQYQYQILRYLTYNTEEQPYPMGDWPEPTPAKPVMTETSEAEVVEEETSNDKREP